MSRLILPLPGNEPFAAQLADALGGELGRIETRHFPDGESYVRLHGDPSGRAVNLVCSLAQPDRQFLPLVFDGDPRAFHGVMPYRDGHMQSWNLTRL